MGCDIHLVVEKRVGGKWERVAGIRETGKLPPRACGWCDGRGHYEGRPSDKCYWCEKESIPGQDTKPYKDRNYTVFSILADVRNDGYVKPISEPRGIPEDATHAVGKDEEGNDKADGEYGDHSFSWLTLAELLAYDWKSEREDEGWVDAPTFQKWDAAGAKGPPDSWCAGVGGQGIEHVTHAAMRRYIADGMTVHPLIERVAGRRSFFTLIRWSFSPAESYCKSFLVFMESLRSIGDPEDVRIVFGFDS